MSTPRPEAPTTPAVPKPAASVVLVRDAPPGSPEPLEAYMIRRNRNMKFLGGYYAFPGGKVDPGDGLPDAIARCRGVRTDEAEVLLTEREGVPALAFWVTAVRELLEESGILLACDEGGRGLDLSAPPLRRDEDGRARRVGTRLSGSVLLARRADDRPPRRPPQVPGHRRSDGSGVVELRLEAEPISRLK